MRRTTFGVGEVSTQKAMLARLLATENISVEHRPNISTAAFDVENRRLLLPVFKSDMSKELYDLFVGHEVGHALWTDRKFFEKLEKSKNGYKTTFNIVEDARIEKLIQKRYPGIVRSFRMGYKELLDKKLFGELPEDMSELGLLDRVNLHFKLGATFNIPFSPQEQVVVDEIANAITTQDVLIATKHLYDLAKDKINEKPEQPKKGQEKRKEHNENPEDASEDPNSDITDNEEGEEGNEEGNEKGEEGNEEGNEEGEEGNEEDSSSGEGNEEGEEGNEEDSSSEGGNSGSAEVKDPKEEEKEPVSITDNAFEKASETMVNKGCTLNVNHVNLPTEDQYSNLYNNENGEKGIVKSLKYMEEKLNEHVNRYLTNHDMLDNCRKKFEAWKRDETKVVNFLVKEFEMKKAAAVAKRVSIRNSGVLDMNSLHKVKYSEDVFRRNNILPEGKNHGLIMVLDWSSSMEKEIFNCLKQTMTFCMFCRKANIPFDVYTFTNGAPKPECQPGAKDNDLLFMDVSMCHLFSSKMTAMDFQKMMFNMFVSLMRNGIGRPYCLTMSGTPIASSVMVIRHLLKKFIKENRIQIANLVYITDGDGNGFLNYNVGPKEEKSHYYVIHDRETGYSYDVRNKNSKDFYLRIDDCMFEIVSDRFDCNVIGFFLCGNNAKAKEYINRNSYTYMMTKDYDVKKSFEELKKYNSTSFPRKGYTDFFVIGGGSSYSDRPVKTQDTMNNILEEMKYKAAQFVKERTILSRFINLIAAK